MQPVGDWYLIANRNDLAVKILSAITVGETADGELVIDGREPADRWVTLTVDDAQQLLVSYQQQCCTLESPGKWVTHGAGLAVPRGTLFELPNNEIYVSGDLQRGVVEQRVLVACRLDEPLPEPVEEPVVQTALPAASEAVATPAADIAVPASTVETVVREQPAPVPPVADPTEIPSPDAPQQARAPAQSSAWKWAVLAVLPLTVALVYIADLEDLLRGESSPPGEVSQQPIAAQIEPLEHEAKTTVPNLETEADSQLEPEADPEPELKPEPEKTALSADAGPTAAQDLTEPAEVAQVDQVQAPVLPERIAPELLAREPRPVNLPRDEDLAVLQEAPFTTQERGPVEAGLAQPTVAVAPGEPVGLSNVNIEVYLARARELLADGFVTWPEDNAVVRLQQVLAVDPGHEEAQRLLDDAADTLLNEAQLAYDDGFVEGALQVVNSVLRFNPGMRRAREMRAQFARP